MDKIIKKSFVLYASYKEQIDLLSIEQRGMLLTAIMQYETDGTVIDGLDGMTLMCFSFIRSQIIRDEEKYTDVSSKRSDSGSKGGAPRGNSNASKNNQNNQNNQNKQKQAKTSKTSKTTYNDNDDDNDNDNEDDINTPPTPQGDGVEDANDSELEARGISDELKEKAEAWIEYKKQGGRPVSDIGKREFYSKLAKEAKKHGDAALVELLSENMASGYAGITWNALESRSRGHPKNEGNRFNQFKQRDYDFDELEKMLVTN